MFGGRKGRGDDGAIAAARAAVAAANAMAESCRAQTAVANESAALANAARERAEEETARSNEERDKANAAAAATKLKADEDAEAVFRQARSVAFSKWVAQP